MSEKVTTEREKNTHNEVTKMKNDETETVLKDVRKRGVEKVEMLLSRNLTHFEYLMIQDVIGDAFFTGVRHGISEAFKGARK